MNKLRYNRTFKKGIYAILFGTLLFSSVIVFFIASLVQYNALTSGMMTAEATIVDIDHIHHHKGPNEQKIFIKYEVNGVTYERVLKTDTAISFAPGRGAHYSVGDRIEILYDPQSPETIATSRSIGVGSFYMGIALFGLAVLVFALIFMFKHKRSFLVTQAEYEKEKEDIDKAKKDAKGQKKLAKEEKKKQKKQKRAEWRAAHARSVKVIRITLVILAIPVALFVFLLLFGMLLRAFGYK